MKSQMRRKGGTAVLFTIMLPVLLVFVGFAVDLAYMQLTRAELRAATDLAAKAASTVLADTGDLDEAIARGKEIAQKNQVAGMPLTLENSDFVFGNTTRSLTGSWNFSPGSSPTNAIQVNSSRTASRDDGEVQLYFSRLFGRTGFAPEASATASFVNADICLVLDRSSSMKLAVSDTALVMSGGDPRGCVSPYSDSRWVAVQNAVDTFIARMNSSLADERVALVTFASDYNSCGVNTDAVTLNQSLTASYTNIGSAMSNLSSSVWNGMTEISKGIDAAKAELDANGRDTANKLIIVLTDGAYTNDVHPMNRASLAAEAGYKVHTITFGSVPPACINEMVATAEAGNGSHFHAPDADTLHQVFSDLAGAISVLTQ